MHYSCFSCLYSGQLVRHSMSGQLNPNAESKPNAQRVVMKAYIKACEALEVKSDVRAAMLGVDASTLTRNMERGFGNEKTRELQLQFVRLYRSLFAIAGGDQYFMRHWFNAGNRALHGIPSQLCLTIFGIFSVNQYLDAMRGKV